MFLMKLRMPCLLLYWTLLLLACTTKQSAEAASFIYAGCSPNKYDPITAFQNHLNSLLTSLVSGASLASYNSYTSGDDSGSPPGMAAYGLYQCRNDLSAGDCSACVQSAVSQLGLVCPGSFAASLQLDGCFVRYSNEDFLGKPDTTMVYRKCSTVTSGDEAFFQRRDDVLADLQNGVSFRVSSSGTVQGVVQCLGDLNGADCSACLSQAVGQLKNACGSALAADVYLAQCYARYWASGHYFHTSADYTDGDDDIGRIVAIIVGILAGLALVVVFLSFLKRACKFSDPHRLLL
ncbi:unnamed protein product [Musa acuminata subsp. malaccensis]|uniref:(wild Malaysian banana) hypothetical protein n=1 Tax=Musa acuminata subsp. malaccensis TaxID=214687 RepID=A0A804IT86_MUSAM|nr:unnamed protein product [Musa acuminata subsp. malaccensis]